MQYTLSTLASKEAYQAAIIVNQQKLIETMADLLREEEIIYCDKEDGQYRYVASGDTLMEGT